MKALVATLCLFSVISSAFADPMKATEFRDNGKAPSTGFTMLIPTNSGGEAELKVKLSSIMEGSNHWIGDQKVIKALPYEINYTLMDNDAGIDMKTDARERCYNLANSFQKSISKANTENKSISTENTLFVMSKTKFRCMVEVIEFASVQKCLEFEVKKTAGGTEDVQVPATVDTMKKYYKFLYYLAGAGNDFEIDPVCGLQ